MHNGYLQGSGTGLYRCEKQCMMSNVHEYQMKNEIYGPSKMKTENGGKILGIRKSHLHD